MSALLLLLAFLGTPAPAAGLFPLPRADFSAVLSEVAVPPLQVAAVGQGFRAWCQRMLAPVAIDPLKPLKPARTMDEAVAVLDEYARRLAASYPADIGTAVLNDYYTHATVKAVSFNPRPAMAEYTYEEEEPAILIEETLLEKSAIYLRILLIHEALVHKAQHLMLLRSRGRTALMAHKQSFRRVSELSAYATEWDLAHLIPFALLAEDLRETTLRDEEIIATASLWGRSARLSLEEHLGQCYGAYFLGDSERLKNHPLRTLLRRSRMVMDWEDRGLRPFAEIRAVISRSSAAAGR